MRATLSLITLFYISIQARYCSFAYVISNPNHRAPTPLFSMSSSSSRDFLSNVRVMVNGMPGPMATSAAEACLRKGTISHLFIHFDYLFCRSYITLFMQRPPAGSDCHDRTRYCTVYHQRRRSHHPAIGKGSDTTIYTATGNRERH